MVFLSKDFAGRILIALEQRGMSQSGLATALGVSRSTVTGWIRYGKLPDAFLLYRLCQELGCSSDWLLGLDTVIEKQDSGLKWIEEIPEWIMGIQREQIQYGIQIFNRLVVDNCAAEDIKNKFNWQAVNHALLAALRSGAIRLTHVPRSEPMERQIKQQYPFLREVVVADVPRCYDDTLIRTEIVTFLAARDILSRVIRPGAVGLGSGYTMLRLCEQSIPAIDQFSGTKWVPLLAFRPDNHSDYTANTLARLMSIRHPGSHALYLPHPDEPQTTAHDTQRAMKNMQAVFVSVSGVDRRDRSGQGHLLSEFRSADYAAEAPDLRETYANLPRKETFGGELLRYLLDTNGKVISRDPAVGAQVELDILRYNSEVIGRVWIVAARDYKAKAVLTCIKNRLANALVIDSEIAAYLIENAG